MRVSDWKVSDRCRIHKGFSVEEKFYNSPNTRTSAIPPGSTGTVVNVIEHRNEVAVRWDHLGYTVVVTGQYIDDLEKT